MKRNQKAAIAAVMTMLLLSACNSEVLDDNIESLTNISEASLKPLIDSGEQSAENVSEEISSENKPEQSESSNILIAYFSRWGNTEYPDDVDATTSAIFYAQTDNPNLSVDVIPIGRVTSDLSVFDELGSSAEITFSLAE